MLHLALRTHTGKNVKTTRQLNIVLVQACLDSTCYGIGAFDSNGVYPIAILGACFFRRWAKPQSEVRCRHQPPQRCTTPNKPWGSIAWETHQHWLTHWLVSGSRLEKNPPLSHGLSIFARSGYVLLCHSHAPVWTVTAARITTNKQQTWIKELYGCMDVYGCLFWWNGATGKGW